MTDRDYTPMIEGYVADVLSGRVPACRWVRLACERHRRDMERAAAGGPFVFDPYHANHLCAFVETMPHIKGKLAGRRGADGLIRLEPWQAFVYGSINGWRWRETALRRFEIVYLEISRKNAKSTMAAPIGLFLLGCDGEPGAEVYCAATKAEQSKIVFDLARLMAQRNVSYRRHCNARVETKTIKLGDGDSFMTSLASKTLDGLNVHGAVVDELHEHKDSTVWDALEEGRSSRSQPLLFAISTAGKDIAGVCFEKRTYLTRVLEGVAPDDGFFGAIWTLDEGDDPFDEAVWPKANPNYRVSKTVEYMRGKARRARASARDKASFLRKDLNIWTSAGVTAFDMDQFRAAEDPSLKREDFAGAAADGGVTAADLARQHDFCAVETEFWRDRELLTFGDYFATEAVVNADGNEYLRQWADEGLLHVCPGHLMDYQAVQACILEHRAHFGSAEIALDPHYGAQMIQALAADLPDGAVVEYRNSPMQLDQPFQELQGLVNEGRLVTDGNPVRRWMFSNCVIRNSGAFEVPAKLNAANKIDAVSACCMALGRMIGPLDTQPPQFVEDAVMVL